MGRRNLIELGPMGCGFFIFFQQEEPETGDGGKIKKPRAYQSRHQLTLARAHRAKIVREDIEITEFIVTVITKGLI